MAYQSGSVSTPTALFPIIETFALANGWTLNAGSGSWLSKGQSHVRFSDPTTENLRISGSNSADGTVELNANTMGIKIPAGSWPVNYELFANSTPDQIQCVLIYETNKIQTIVFGDIVKVHNSAYVGGNWFWASRAGVFGVAYPGLYSLSDTAIQASFGHAGAPMPFPQRVVVDTIFPDEVGQVHCKIDSRIWPWSWGTGSINNGIILSDGTVSSIFRSPNSWNGQANLVPMNLQFPCSGGLYSYIGFIEHLRLIRVDNYNVGDIVTLGTDTWKVYPWLQKNLAQLNGINVSSSTTYLHSGTLGFAVRYTP